MAETIKIEIKFNPKNYEHTFGLPNRIEVERNSRIEWIIKDPFVLEEIFLSKKKFRNGIKLTLYFESSSAFEWKSESVNIYGFLPYFPRSLPIRIATGVAKNKGDHKYGLKLMSAENFEDSEPDYDDDPYLTVY